MKRRNFFSKISKGLLGIGVLGAIPETPVETSIEPSLNPSYTVDSNMPKGFVWDGEKYIILEKNK